jgi:hypothetical protein
MSDKAIGDAGRVEHSETYGLWYQGSGSRHEAGLRGVCKGIAGTRQLRLKAGIEFVVDRQAARTPHRSQARGRFQQRTLGQRRAAVFCG